MAKIKIDDFDVVSEDLSVDAKITLAQLKLLDEQILRIELERQTFEFAHNECVDTLRNQLQNNPN